VRTDSKQWRALSSASLVVQMRHRAVKVVDRALGGAAGEEEEQDRA
jgi:hypothetical protein